MADNTMTGQLVDDGQPGNTAPGDTGGAGPDPRKSARALRELRRPVAGRIRLACVLSALGALAGLAPFVGLVELADALLATPMDRDRVALVAVLIVLGLLLRGMFMSAALTITHLADVRLQAILRRRMIAHLGRVPLGWYTQNSSGRLRKTAMGDVDALHQLVAHHAVDDRCSRDAARRTGLPAGPGLAPGPARGGDDPAVRRRLRLDGARRR
jgi:ABC-type multidrug transport system fused ATPase/permease subunit